MVNKKSIREQLELTQKQKYYIQIGAIAAGVIASALQASRFVLDHKENRLTNKLMDERER